jgi:hypothetical protein
MLGIGSDRLPEKECRQLDVTQRERKGLTSVRLRLNRL